MSPRPSPRASSEPASASCSRRPTTPRCGTPPGRGASWGSARSSTYSARSPTRPAPRLAGARRPEARRSARRLALALARLGVRHALVVSGEEGLDEISIAGPTTVFEVRGEEVSRRTLVAGRSRAPPPRARGRVAGGTPEENAALLQVGLRRRGAPGRARLRRSPTPPPGSTSRGSPHRFGRGPSRRGRRSRAATRRRGSAPSSRRPAGSPPAGGEVDGRAAEAHRHRARPHRGRRARAPRPPEAPRAAGVAALRPRRAPPGSAGRLLRAPRGSGTPRTPRGRAPAADRRDQEGVAVEGGLRRAASTRRAAGAGLPGRRGGLRLGAHRGGASSGDRSPICAPRGGRSATIRDARRCCARSSSSTATSCARPGPTAPTPRS